MESEMSKNREECPKDTNSNLCENDLIKNYLEQLGFDEWFQNKSKPYLKDDFIITRIVEVNKTNYKVSSIGNDLLAELSGKFHFNTVNRTDFPAVGDWVVAQSFNDNSFAIIHDILPRKSLLRRKDPGKAVEFQLIAANIDYAFIIQSVDSNFNLNRLERYLVMSHESDIQPIIVLSKTDLITENELLDISKSIEQLPGNYLILPISNKTDQGISALKNELKPGKTYCLLGSSGVGKTTLLNRLIGEDMFTVNAVREKDSKGRHTTVKRQLVRLESGSIFIDTPGMRELGNFEIDMGLKETYNDIISYFNQCRFKNCTHLHEDGCAVIAAVEEGNIDESRYNNFIRIQKESAFYELSYMDKRKKDKAFGKMIKNYKKSIRKK